MAIIPIGTLVKEDTSEDKAKKPSDVIPIGELVEQGDSNIIPISNIIQDDPIDAELREHDRKFTISGASQQFATGVLNEALLGFPEYMIRKHMPLGEEILKEMESPVRAERIARGIGSFTGFIAGAPAKLFKIGGKVTGKALQSLVGAKKINRFVRAAASGAGSFGLYETLKAPEEDFGEKITQVPLGIALGAVLGVAGEKLRTVVKIRTLDQAKALGGAENNRVLQRLKQKGVFNNNITTSEGRFLNRQGQEGATISKLFDGVRDTSQIKRNASILEYNKVVKGLNLQEKINFTEVAEGKALPLNSKVTNVAKFWNKVKSGMEKEIAPLDIKVRTSEGLSNFKGIKNYFPHMIIPTDAHPKVVTQTLTAAVKRGDFKNIEAARVAWGEYGQFIKTGNKPNRLISYLIRTGKAKNEKEAQEFLSNFSTKMKQQRFGNLEFAREVDLPFYDVHPDRVLPTYFDGMFERIQQIKAFGQNNEIGKELVSKMREKGLDYKNAEIAINRFLGRGEEVSLTGVSEKTLAAIRSYNTATKLGLAFIPNATQSTNTAILTGIKNTAKGIAKIFTKEGVEFGLRSSNVLETSAHDIASELTQSKGIWASRVLKWTGFKAIEKFNRIVAANAGREYVKNLTKQLLRNSSNKVARRGLFRLGLNPAKIIKQGGLTFDDTLQAALKVVNKTQFRAGIQDLPLLWTSPEGKVLTQFKNFAFSQTTLIKDVILQEAVHGNLQPMITAISLAPVLGEGVKDLRAILSGRKRDRVGLERIAENMASVGGLGIVSDLWQTASFGKFAGALTGPTGSTLGDFAEGAVQTATGKPRKLVRTVAKQVPFVGPLLSNLLRKNK